MSVLFTPMSGAFTLLWHICMARLLLSAYAGTRFSFKGGPLARLHWHDVC